MEPKATSAPTVSPNATTPRMMTGLFRAQADAESAIIALEKRGYRKEDVSVLMSDETRKRLAAHSSMTHTSGEKAAEGAGVGSAVGGVAGAIILGIVAVAAPIAIPGIGLLISGPLVAALAGSGAGGLAGGLIGSLVRVGIPESHAKIYDLGLREGGVLITVQPRSQFDATKIAEDWTALHAENLRY
ncbi:MAG: hypothetical protein JNK05_37895 [Myxococcales bacterium]|nr:hypothetical protein [Myxococcales bacterium]